MQIHTLKPKSHLRRSRRIGRGGKRGTTSGRGTKGQKARAGAKIRPAIRDIIKRIPKSRGRGRSTFKSFRPKPSVVTLEMLEKQFSDGGIINAGALLEKGLIHRVGGRVPQVKILGNSVKKRFTLKGFLYSHGVRQAMVRAGGTIIS